MDRSRTEIECVIDELLARKRGVDAKPEPPNPERFPPDTMFCSDEIAERELYQHSQSGAGLVSVLFIVALSWVYGAMCGYGFCSLN